mmetsp:Transcript_21507/g.54996  ORF Transcript_21507/g.54996 Transcript_21507/m.54996 type:complete len:227 (+) Transcript_21507:1-681(+)
MASQQEWTNPDGSPWVPPTYFAVLDFEATCEDGDRKWPNEIIEFPTVLIDAATLKTVDEFRTFVKPVLNPQLTPFCTKLTGITQDQVDEGLTIQDTMAAYQVWCHKHGLTPENTLFVTCGDWDLNRMLPAQLKYDHSTMEIDPIFHKWCNIKKIFGELRGQGRPGGMTAMLDGLQLPLVGRHHSGIDDCRNIARILCKLVEDHGRTAVYENGFRVPKAYKKAAAQT